MTQHPDNTPKPMADPSDMDNSAWIIWFEDAERSPEIFSGYGARDAAFRRFEALNQNWNCHLFQKVLPAPATPKPGQDGGERTPQDYAIEHGRYMADAAEAFIASILGRNIAEDDDHADELDDHLRTFRLRIHNFRKRADRAALTRQERGAVTDADVRRALDAYSAAIKRGVDPLSKNHEQAVRAALEAALSK